MPMRDRSQRHIQESIEGLTIYDSRFIDGIEPSVVALGLVASAINAVERKGAPYDPAEMYELMLSAEVETKEAALWMGKSAQEYGGDFAVLEMRRAAASNRVTDVITRRLPALVRHGLRFVFVEEGDSLTEAQDHRVEILRNRIGELAVPAMRLLPSIEPPADISTEYRSHHEHGSDVVVERHFTLDDRLVYPLILRRTATSEQEPEEGQLSLTD